MVLVYSNFMIYCSTSFKRNLACKDEEAYCLMEIFLYNSFILRDIECINTGRIIVMNCD